MTIEEFIEARLIEDEAAARSATQAPWSYNPSKQWHDGMDFETLTNPQEFVGYGGPSPFRGCIATTGEASDPQSMADAAHIARHDPARVLRQCAAIRAMLRRHGEAERDPVLSERDAGFEAGMYVCLELVAAAWSDHGDYDPSWAPDAGGSKP